MGIKTPPYVAHGDGNQQFSVMGVEGTLGTADTSGTARPLPVGVNPSTGAMYVEDLSGVSGTSNIQGSVNVYSGTVLNTGTNVNVVSGSLVGTVVNNMPTGTITTGSLTNIANLVNGSIRMTVGTLTSGSLTDVASLYSGTINVGTFVQPSGTVTTIVAGTQNTLGTVGNLNNGSINVLTGTITSVTNLAAGTIKIDPTPIPTTLTFGTLGTAGGSFFGTLSAASGAGTKHYVSAVDIVVQSGTADVRVLAGSLIQGTGLLAAGFFVPSAGISTKFNPAFVTGTNSELLYHFVGAGTAMIRVSYWKGV